MIDSTGSWRCCNRDFGGSCDTLSDRGCPATPHEAEKRIMPKHNDPTAERQRGLIDLHSYVAD